jgi:hypothetical protein
MKTKIKILIVSCVIAAAAVTGFNLAQNSNNMDVTLADISLMAMARGESGCCIAYSVDEHCGMKKEWDDTGPCCQSSDTACDKCIMKKYRECS